MQPGPPAQPVKKVDARGGVRVMERSKASPIRSSNRFYPASVVSWAVEEMSASLETAAGETA
jgi:hypothetical protein